MSLPKESTAYEQQIVALGRVLQTIREEENSSTLVNATVEYIRNGFDYTLVWIGLYDRIAHRIVGQGGFTPNGDSNFLLQRFNLNPGDVLEQVVIQQRPLGIPDLREESRAGEWRKAAQTFQIQGTMVFPIRRKDRCFGIALLGSRFWGVSPHSGEKARLSVLFGSLAEALYQIEIDQQRQQAKRPDQPLLKLLGDLRNLGSLNARLEATVEETHRFIQPDRTNIYWFEREQRYFWRRISNRPAKKLLTSPRDTKLPDINIAVQEISGFYKALAADQLVAIGEAQSSLKGDTTTRLMQQIQARSLLAAPILFQDELLGFLAVEGKEARIWTEEEKSYVQGAAQLVALAAPLSEMEETIDQIKVDQGLTAEISHAICSDRDWQTTLQTCADQLSQRLHIAHFLVLMYNPDQLRYDICYQAHPGHRQRIQTAFAALNDVDRKMMEKATEPISIENLEDDLKLMAWRQPLLDSGVRSLLVCNTAMGKPLEGVIIIAHAAPRSWTRVERDLVKTVAQQIGVILHQWQLQRDLAQQQELQQQMQWGIKTLQRVNQIEELNQLALEQILQAVQAPLAVLVTWDPEAEQASIELALIRNASFNVDLDAQIPINTDVLIQWSLQSEGVLPLMATDLPVETRQWLHGSGIGTVITTALRTTSAHQPSGVLIVADRDERVWSERYLELLGVLTSQYAWCRRHLRLTHRLTSQRLQLQQLSWYKQHFLEDLQRTLSAGVRRLTDLGQQLVKPQNATMSTMRLQQIVRQLGSSLATVASPVANEQWQLVVDNETVPLASLLKRMIERVDSLIRQRQLWTQVHNDLNISIVGDVAKIEFILHDLMEEACVRSLPGGRIDVWCRLIDQRWLELSITDNGIIDQDLIESLQQLEPQDWLMPSVLNQPPGLNLAICRSLMQQVGGEFNLYQLEDGRVLSQVLLAVANGTPLNKPSTNAIDRQTSIQNSR
jgi:GAF domain-containing protein